MTVAIDPDIARKELARRKKRRSELLQFEKSWNIWLPRMFPSLIYRDHGDFHIRFWEWLWRAVKSKKNSVSPRPYCALWARGFGKSTVAEIAPILIAAMTDRRYMLYVRATEAMAQNSITNMKVTLETEPIGDYYPSLSGPQFSSHGGKLGWSKNFLYTKGDKIFHGLGFDSKIRGLRREETRPDVLILDDIDDKGDSPLETQRKEDVIRHTILPALSPGAIIFFMQNLIIPDGIASRLARPDYHAMLTNRIIDGPIPAISEDFTYEYIPDDRRFQVLTGEPIWKGFGIPQIEDALTLWGPVAFMREAQHEVGMVEGGMFSDVEYRRCTSDQVPPLKKVVCWIDPAISALDKSDSCAIQIDGLAEDGDLYRLYSWERIETPSGVMRHAILKAIEYGATKVGVETDQGGETWESVYQLALDHLQKTQTLRYIPAYDSAKASSARASKLERIRMMLSDYERMSIIHVIGTHHILEHALNRFPEQKPYDLADAAWHSWADLRERTQKKKAGVWGM